MKICTRCGEGKPLDQFYRMSQSRDGLRPDCKKCTKLAKEQYKRDNPVDYRIKVMATTILKRVKYCHWDGYEHLRCYKENNVKCNLGSTPKEVASVLKYYFYTDIKHLIDEGKTPSVDRIDPKGDYELGNIRIIDVVENGKEGFINANKARMKPVRAHFIDGRTEDFQSLNEAQRKLGIHSSAIRGLIKRGGKSRKDGIRFTYI